MPSFFVPSLSVATTLATLTLNTAPLWLAVNANAAVFPNIDYSDTYDGEDDYLVELRSPQSSISSSVSSSSLSTSDSSCSGWCSPGIPDTGGSSSSTTGDSSSSDTSSSSSSGSSSSASASSSGTPSTEHHPASSSHAASNTNSNTNGHSNGNENNPFNNDGGMSKAPRFGFILMGMLFVAGMGL